MQEVYNMKMATLVKKQEVTITSVLRPDSTHAIKQFVSTAIHNLVVSYLISKNSIIEHSIHKQSTYEFQYFVVLKNDNSANRQTIEKFFDAYDQLENSENFSVHIHFISTPAFKELKKNPDFKVIQ
jgi:hypothetical protein